MKPTTQLSTIINKLTIITCLGLMPCALSYAEEDRTGLLLNGAISLEHTDNVLNKIDTLAESDTAYSIKPSAQYLGLIGKHKFTFNYDGNLTKYGKGDELNYNEHKINVLAQLEHSNKLATEFKLGFDKTIEEPGSTNASTLELLQFNKYTVQHLMAKVYYGEYESTGQIVIEYNINDKEYTNNQQAFRDIRINELTGKFYYRVAPKTRILLQMSTNDYSYDDNIVNDNFILNQSSKDHSYLIGAEWRATAKSTGIFKIGYLNKNYDNNIFTDVSGLSYELDMIWQPHPFTNIALAATRAITESAALNNQGFITTVYSFNISHQIQPRTKLVTKYLFNHYDINSNRTDKRHTINFKIKHNLRSWLNVNLYYKYQERTSNLASFEYNSNSIGLTFETLFK